MSDLISISKQIEKLQREAADIKKRDFQATVHDILQTMQAYGITVKDLQSAPSGRGRKAGKGAAKLAKVPKEGKKKAAKATGPVEAKYRGPNGETWSGRGLTPKWLTALEASGRAKSEFLIQGQIPSPVISAEAATVAQ